MSFLNRRMTCFYCGQSTKLRWKRGLRKFQCEGCEAVNYLDEVRSYFYGLSRMLTTTTQNGEITDPPAPSSVKQTQRFTSPPPDSSFYQPKYESEEVFCRICLQNQHIVAQSLASYDSDSNLAERKARLERQYPPVCRDCKPRVEKKLREADYLAKADHLRRQAIKTRQGKTHPDFRWTWRDAVLLIGGWLWWTSQIIEISWHILGLLPISPTQENLRSESLLVLVACSIHAFWTRQVQVECYDALTRLERTGLILGFVSLWWHAKLSQKLHSPSLRLSGYGDYILMQIFTLVLRSLLWWVLQGEYRAQVLGGVPVNAVHATSLLLTVISSFAGARRLQVTRPQLDFLKRSTSSLVVVEEESTSTMTPRPSVFQSDTHASSSFPISKLASPYDVHDVDLDLGYASASETDADDDAATIASISTVDEMDWTPTQPKHTLSPRRPVPTPKQTLRSLRSAERTPFHGTLPPAPEPPSFKALKPKAPVFKATSEQKKDNFFAQMMGRADSGDPADLGGKKAQRKDYEIQDGKLRIPDRRDSTTGLENLFSSSFQIDDEPQDKSRQRAGDRHVASTAIRNETRQQRDSGFGFWMIGVLVLVGCIFGVTHVTFPGFYGSITKGLALVWRS